MYASGSCPVHGEGSHALEDFGFNIVSDAIVRFPGVNNHAGATEMMMVPDGGGGQKPFLVPLLEPGQKVQLLGARLDGSIAWFESPAAWEENKHEHLLQLGGRQP